MTQEMSVYHNRVPVQQHLMPGISMVAQVRLVSLGYQVIPGAAQAFLAPPR